jgi:hypothetical protein
MKITLQTALILLVVCLPARSQLILNAGESYSYQFSTLPITGFVNVGAPPGATLITYLEPTSWQGDAALRFEMFEDAPGGGLLLSRTVTPASPPLDLYGESINGWNDLQGSIRLTAMTNSILITSFQVQARRAAGTRGVNIYSINVVPPPRLSFQRLGESGLQLSWTTNATDYVLQFADSLPAPVWHPVTDTVGVRERDYVVAMTPSNAQRYFRLSKPQ